MADPISTRPAAWGSRQAATSPADGAGRPARRSELLLLSKLWPAGRHVGRRHRAAAAAAAAPWGLVSKSADDNFACTQAMIVSGLWTRQMGEYVQRRVHPAAPCDHLVDGFCRRRSLSVADVYPSLVQHVGRRTVGPAGGGHLDASDFVLATP